MLTENHIRIIFSRFSTQRTFAIIISISQSDHHIVKLTTDMNWVQTVWKDHQQTTKFSAKSLSLLPLFPAEVKPAALTAVMGLAWASVPAAAPVIGRPKEEGMPIRPWAAVPILAPAPRAGAPLEAVWNMQIDFLNFTFVLLNTCNRYLIFSQFRYIFLIIYVEPKIRESFHFEVSFILHIKDMNSKSISHLQ